MSDADSLDNLTKVAVANNGGLDDASTTKKAGPDDFSPLLSSVFGCIRYKFFLFLFFLFLIISSDVFIVRLLSKIDNATVMGTPTSYGKLVQGAALIAGGMVIDGLCNLGIV